MTHVTRRGFLGGASAVTLAFMGLRTASARGLSASRADAPGFGALRPDARGVLDLPDGFDYTIFSRTGERMDDGLLVPSKHDGMAAFPAEDGLTLLVRNHETAPDMKNAPGPFGDDLALLSGVPRDRLYDAGFGRTPGSGGTTTLLFDTRSQTLRRHWLSLAGTHRNCAGGPTPWGSWITCEETVVRANQMNEKDHGYNFEVPARNDLTLVEPRPLKAMGRFNHEAVAVDPASGVVYQTEDRHDGLLYRFIPSVRGHLHRGGRLQALRLRDHPSADTRHWETPGVFHAGVAMPVEWADLDGTDAPEDDLRLRGFERHGCARFARGEGMWYGRDAVYFACTNGGPKRKGQVWRYDPSPDEAGPGEAARPGTLELFIEPDDGTLVDNADNLTVAPWGDLILCEDGESPQFIVGVTPDGRVYQFARNALNSSELAGACFSPDGSTLFVNIQTPGLTLAITGPWRA